MGPVRRVRREHEWWRRPGVGVRRYGVTLEELVRRVDHRGVEIPLIAAEHAERLVLVAEERAEVPRELHADESEEQRPHTHDGDRIPRVDTALFTDQRQASMQGDHAENPGDRR